MWHELLGQAVSRRGDEETFIIETAGRRWVVKARPRPLPLDPFLARLPRTQGVSQWEDFSWEVGSDRLLAARTFIAGKTVTELRGELTLGQASSLTVRLRDLHDAGVIHGDVQPANVIVSEDGQTHLIDLALFRSRPGESGHVAGSAPYMAPELWEGAPASEASDRYALATMLIEALGGHLPFAARDLSGWATTHRTSSPDARGVSDSSLRALLERMLAREPSARPPLQELLDAFARMDAAPEPTRATFWPVEMEETVRSIRDSVAAGTSLTLRARRSEGRAEIGRDLVDRLQIAGEKVVALLGSDRMRPRLVATDRTEGPWSSALAMIDGARALSGLGPKEIDVRHGDQLHVFESLTAALLEAANEVDRLILVWDSVDDAGPDVEAWWNFLKASIAQAGHRKAVTVDLTDRETPSGLEVRPTSVSEQSWRRWRAQTLRAEVRDIAEGRFDELIEDHGHGWRATLDAIDREIGARPDPSRSSSTWNTAKLIRVGETWRAEVESLVAERAFGAATQLCSNLWQAIRHRKTVDASMRQEVLAVWTDAVIQGGVRPEQTTALEAGLRESDEAFTPILLARILYRLGRHDEGLEALAEVSDSSSADAWRAQLMLSSGKFDEAKEAAQRGLRSDDLPADDETRLQLELLVLAGDAIRGDASAIEGIRDLGPALDEAGASASLRARAHAYRAIGLNRRDALDEATDAYLRALEEVESAGLDSELPTYLLNVGTAYHRQGRLGLAREYYARGVRLSQTTTRASTRGLLMTNQANVDIALGRLEESRTLVERAQIIGEQNQLRAVLVVCRQLMGDIELASGRAERALEIWRDALGDESLPLTGRQRAELELSIAEALVTLERERDAGRAIDRARRIIEEERLTDFEHHLGVLRARLQWAEGSSLGTMAGIELFRRSLLGGQKSGNHRLVLRQAPHLVARLEDEGLTELLQETATVVQSSRNAIAMGLTKELREDFFAQLPEVSRRAIGGESTTRREPAKDQPRQSTAPSGPIVDRFYRMLSLNEMILGSASLDELLETSLEIALSLSNAERGFVLLRAPEESRIGPFKVAASRDIDGTTIPQPHLEVSLTIAEEAARTGRTVTTINAREDQRFNAALSVVDLDLTSVLCVPIRDGSGLLGALYLDHRFQPGVFEGEVPRMMEAFGHQVALAITNARRLEELEGERRQLAEANGQLDELLAEREAELEGMARRVASLSDEVERRASGLREAFPDIVFTSTVMERLLDQVRRVARGDVPVVVTGESGVGKELVARAVHDASPRRDGPFVALNCGAVSESLFESEMFGHVRGAFTGADIDRQGLFVAANGGTIFLDEIGEMPLSMQVKLLRVLQERRVRRVGATETESVDVRVVAATNRDLGEMVGEETFREDLYYRLAAITLEVPALRDRREDIPLIAQSILERFAPEPMRLAPESARLLRRARWRGNVRELENTLRAASVLAKGDVIGPETIAPLIQIERDGDAKGQGVKSAGGVETRGRRRKATREDVVEALRRAGEDRERAAELLGVSERTLYRYLKRWDLY